MGVGGGLLIERCRMETLASILRDLHPRMWMVLDGVPHSEVYISSPSFLFHTSTVPEVRVKRLARSPSHLLVECSTIRPGCGASALYEVVDPVGGKFAL